MNSTPPHLRVVPSYRRLGLTEQLNRLEALRRELASLPDDTFPSARFAKLNEQYWTALRELVFDRPLRDFLIEHHPGPPYEQ